MAVKPQVKQLDPSYFVVCLSEFIDRYPDETFSWKAFSSDLCRVALTLFTGRHFESHELSVANAFEC